MPFLVLRQSSREALKCKGIYIYLRFRDYAKALERVKHAEFFEMLASLDIDGKDLRHIRNYEVATSSEVKGLDLNVKKTECMVTIKKNHVLVCELKREEQIIQRDKFKYLGYTITSDGKDLNEIKKRIVIARSIFNKMDKVLKSKNIKV